MFGFHVHVSLLCWVGCFLTAWGNASLTRAPSLQQVLEEIRNAPNVFSDTLHGKAPPLHSDLPVEHTGLAVSWNPQGIPLIVRNYCEGLACRKWYVLDEAGLVREVAEYQPPEELGRRYYYRADGTLEREEPDCCPLYHEMHFDRIFSGGDLYGPVIEYDDTGRIKRSDHRERNGRTVTWIFHPTGKPAYHSVSDATAQERRLEQWCPDGRLVGRIRMRFNEEGDPVERGRVILYSSATNKHYRWTTRKERSTLRRLPNGKRLKYRTQANVEAAMTDLQLHVMDWNGGDGLRCWPCSEGP